MSRVRRFPRRLLLGTLAVLAAGTGLGLWLSGADAAPTCSIWWTGSASTTWEQPANWSARDGGTSIGRLPARSDVVCMSTTPQRAAAVVASSVTVNSIIWPATPTVTPTLNVGAANLSSGGLTVGSTTSTTTSAIARLQVVQGRAATNGTVSTRTLSIGPSGTLAGNGTFSVSGTGSTLSLAGGTVAGGVHIVNSGSGTVAQGATVVFTDNSILDNLGTLALGDDSNLYDYRGGRLLNERSGTVRYSGSAVSSTATVGVDFDNAGTVSVPKGTLRLSGGSSPTGFDAGSYDAAATGVIAFTGGTRTFGSATFPGAGQIALYSTIQLRNTPTLMLSNLLVAAGTITGHGTVVVPSGGAADLAGGALVGGVRLLNQGTLTEAATAQVYVQDGAVIENAGAMTLADDAQLRYYNSSPGGFRNDPGATLTYTGSASSSVTTIQLPFDNLGAVKVVKGSLQLQAGSSGDEVGGDTGSYTVNPAGALLFQGGTRLMAQSVTFPGLGVVVVASTLSIDSGTTLSFPNVQVSGGTFDGAGVVMIPAGASATFDGTSLSRGVQVVVRGDATVATNSGLSFYDGALFENAGTLALADGNYIGASGPNGRFVNDAGATIVYAGSASNSTTAISVPFDNYGSVSVTRGTLTTSGGSSEFSAGDTGSYTVAPTAYLTSSESRQLAAGSSFPGAGQLTVNGTLIATTNVTIPTLALNGSLVVGPGATATVAVVGTPTGTVEFRADRPAHYGRLVATGTFDATSLSLQISHLGFTPPCGTSFVPLTAGSLVAPFARVSSDVLPSYGSVAAGYKSTSAKIVITCQVPSVSVTQTYGAGPGLDGSNPSGYRGEPVNTATGAYATEQTDASLGGLGLPFSFQRFYSSNYLPSGRLGSGWTDSFSAALAPGNPVVVTAENGQQSRFYQQNDGSYQGESTVESALSVRGSGYALTRRDGTTLSFTASGVLTSIKDRNGRGVTLGYSNGVMVNATDSAGHVVKFTYSGGLLTTVTLPLSRTVKYGYSSGLLTTVTDPGGKITRLAYTNGLLSRVTNARGAAVVTNTYDGSSRVVKQVDALGKITTYAYDDTADVTTTTDPRGGTWRDTYQNYALIGRTDPLGNVTAYAYDDALHVSAVTDARGNTTLTDYDASGNLLDRTSPAPSLIQEVWTYNDLDEPTSYRDGLGNLTTSTYDGRGNKLTATTPTGAATTNTYDPLTGALLTTRSPGGGVTTFAYDSFGNRVAETDAVGGKTTATYDAAGRMVTTVSARGNVSGATAAAFTTTYAYDALDRLTSVTDANGHVRASTYDAVGNRITETAPSGAVTTWTYDLANRAITVKTPGGATSTAVYDANGNLVSRTSGNGNTTGWTYDATNRLISQKSPLGGVSTRGYDANGNLVRTVDAVGTKAGSGGVTTFGYDELDRQTSVIYSDGTATVTTRYDAASRIASLTDGTGTTTFTRDAAGRLLKVTKGSTSFSYTYTSDGQVGTRRYADGYTVKNAYDAAQRLTSVTASGGTTTYGYDPDGNPVSVSLPSGTGVTESLSYDNAGLLAAVAASRNGTGLTSYTITRDANDNPTQIVSRDGAATFTYDNEDRLAQACYISCTARTLSYGYDLDGNRTSAVDNAVTTASTFDADDRLTAQTVGGQTTAFAYDADGRLTEAGPNTYTWNLADRMTATTTGGVSSAYTYDGLGNRATEKTGTATTNLAWDVNNPLPQLATTSSTARVDYVQGLGALGFSTGGSNYYDLHDDQGSVVGVVGSNGTLLSTAAYDGFGNVLARTSPVAGSPIPRTAWQGQVLDATGDYDLRARQYDPTAGTFLTRDPVAAGALDPWTSPYLYGGNRPTTLTDPAGTWSLFNSFANLFSAQQSAQPALGDLDRSQPGTSCAINQYVGGLLHARTTLGYGANLVSTYGFGIDGISGRGAEAFQTGYDAAGHANDLYEVWQSRNDLGQYVEDASGYSFFNSLYSGP